MSTTKKQKICRICGKSYPPCDTCERDKLAFHWREVACSLDCGRAYLARVMEGRAGTQQNDGAAPSTPERST